MKTALWDDETVPTLADLLKQIGNINPRRICADPAPGTATEKDVLRFLHAPNKRLYELVDGVLVEKIMGMLESSLACDIIKLLGNHLDENPVGFLTAPDGAVRLMPRLIRIPDISLIRWDQLPTKERPMEPIPDLAPALAVEVLSKGNTPQEINRKLRDYFVSGVRLVWLVDPRRRTVRVFTAPDQSTVLHDDQTLKGGDVLPGLSLPLRQVFAGVPPPLSRSGGKRSTGRNTNAKRT